MKQIRKGKAYVSSNADLLLLAGDADWEHAEAIQKRLSTEHGLLVHTFHAEAEVEVWDEILHLVENNAQGLAYSLLIEKGIIL